MNQAALLAETFTATRAITLGMMKSMDEVDQRKNFEVDGIKLNSPLWIAGHLAWSQNFLQSKVLKGPNPEITWLKEFAFGSRQEDISHWPDWNEVKEALDKVNKICMDHIRKISDDEMDEGIYLESMDWKNTPRGFIIHSIRHEGMHAGHLSWLKKLHGLDTF